MAMVIVVDVRVNENVSGDRLRIEAAKTLRDLLQHRATDSRRRIEELMESLVRHREQTGCRLSGRRGGSWTAVEEGNLPEEIPVADRVDSRPAPFNSNAPRNDDVEVAFMTTLVRKHGARGHVLFVD